MELLKKRILEDGVAISPSILKVDSFLNHQIDGNLMLEVGKEFKRRFENDGITKILTIEASGIAVAIMTALAFDVPMVFAKKKKPSTLTGDVLISKVYSFTKETYYDICLSREFLNENDKVLIVDDFLANGHASLGLVDLVKEANAQIAGIGIVIEKGFQNGRSKILEQGIKLESLAIVESLETNKINFKYQKFSFLEIR